MADVQGVKSNSMAESRVSNIHVGWGELGVFIRTKPFGPSGKHMYGVGSSKARLGGP